MTNVLVCIKRVPDAASEVATVEALLFRIDPYEYFRTLAGVRFRGLLDHLIAQRDLEIAFHRRRDLDAGAHSLLHGDHRTSRAICAEPGRLSLPIHVNRNLPSHPCSNPSKGTPDSKATEPARGARCLQVLAEPVEHKRHEPRSQHHSRSHHH